MRWTLIVEVVMMVFKWGDDLAVELPKALVEEMGLVEGDELDIVEAVDRTFVRKVDRRADALENMRRRAWSAPADYKFDRDEANER
jgi:antitoxin MazE